LSSPEQTKSQDRLANAPGLGWRLLRWLSALGLLSLLGGGGYLLMLWEPQQLPVRVVTVDGAVKRLSPQRLQETVLDHLGGGILTQDLPELKAAVEVMPWVRSASLRRHWPDCLELAVVEQVPVARWGEDALVSADSVIFRPEVGDFPGGLPELSGREEDALQLVERLLTWGPRLSVLGLRIEELALDARGASTLHLSGGITLCLGKAQVEERIARFMRTYPKLTAAGTPSQVDMRYSNGLAVRWGDSPSDGPGLDAEKASRSAQLKSRPSGPSRS